VINVPSELYNYDSPDEHRLPYDSAEIDYNWDIVMK
jgi:dTDP-4-dehydrorhamnose 3,5-epimerase